MKTPNKRHRRHRMLPDSCRCSSWTLPLTSVRSCGPYSTRNQTVRPTYCCCFVFCFFCCDLFCFPTTSRQYNLLSSFECDERAKAFAVPVRLDKRDIGHRESKSKQACCTEPPTRAGLALASDRIRSMYSWQSKRPT